MQKNKSQTRSKLSFRIVKRLVQFFYPKVELVGAEHLPKEPALIVGNHTQLHGPLACELYFPEPRYTWCAGQMMHLRDVPAYAFEDFWSRKPKHTHWYFKLASYLIAPLSVFIFNNAATIAVYRDARIVSTFRNTMRKLSEGANVIIFPECNDPHNHIVNSFQDKFIDVARHYYKKTGTELEFVPMYIAPNLKKMVLGKPIRFNSQAPIEDERRRICDYLMEEITQIALSLPRHTVVPYRNIPKKYYPKNIPEEVDIHEETSR